MILPEGRIIRPSNSAMITKKPHCGRTRWQCGTVYSLSIIILRSGDKYNKSRPDAYDSDVKRSSVNIMIWIKLCVRVLGTYIHTRCVSRLKIDRHPGTHRRLCVRLFHDVRSHEGKSEERCVSLRPFWTSRICQGGRKRNVVLDGKSENVREANSLDREAYASA